MCRPLIVFFIGAKFKRPLLIGLVFVFGWEYVILILPGYLKLLTVAYYLQGLVPHTMPQEGGVNILFQVFQEVPPVPLSLAALAGVTLVGVWLAARATETREYVLEQ